MRTRTMEELKVVTPRSPIPTVEFDLNSLPANLDSCYDEVVLQALRPLAKAHPKARISVYGYYTDSVNFHAPTQSMFLGVAAPAAPTRETLTALQHALSAVLVPNAQGRRLVRASDYIDAQSALLEFHVADGDVWRPYELGRMFALDDEERAADASAERPLGDLYLLAVGVDPDALEQGGRDWYARDARFVREALAGAEPLYRNTHSRLLLGADATRARLLESLEWLEANVRDEDVAILFFSVHADRGEREKELWLYLAETPETPEAPSALAGDALNAGLARLRGRVVLLLDTCHAGALAILPSFRTHRATLIAACAANAESAGQILRRDQPHGYFVIALREALTGQAPLPDADPVRLQHLIEYLPARANALNPEQQALVFNADATATLPLARLATGEVPAPCWAEPLNPFDCPDVPDPDGEDVHAFAAQVRLKGDGRDANAKPWSKIAADASATCIEGTWSGRWRRTSERTWHQGDATIGVQGERVYIRFAPDEQETEDEEYPEGYLIDARRVGDDLLVGRYLNLDRPDDSTPWVGRIVQAGRIDGIWADGRWDFRR